MEILEELEKQNGIVTIACKNTGLPRSTFYNWATSDPEFKAAVDEIQEVAIDYVESKLMEKITGIWQETGKKDDEGEPIVYKVPPSDTAIIFFLKTKGKKRGYIERQEIGTSGEQTVKVEFV